LFNNQNKRAIIPCTQTTINLSIPNSKLSMPRKRFGRRVITNKEKIAMLRQITSQTSNGECSFRKACRRLEVDPAQVCRWKKDRHKILTSNPIAGSLHQGMPSVLEPIEDNILFWFFELRERGLKVSVRMVVLKATELAPPEFGMKSDRARDQVVRRFLKAHDIVHRAVTHESQRAPHEVEKQAKDWMEMIRPMVAAVNRNERFIINMDQTPVFFSMSEGTTLEVEGSRTVNARSSSGSTMRVSLAVAVTASGHILPLLLCLRGSQMAEFNATFAITPLDPIMPAKRGLGWMNPLCYNG
jgi:hypothetical protein